MDNNKNRDWDKLDLPETNRGSEIEILLGKDALARTYDASISADTEIALNADTALLEVTALENNVLLKFKTATGGTAVSTTNFDAVIPAGATRHFGLDSDITHISVIETGVGGIIAVTEF